MKEIDLLSLFYFLAVYTKNRTFRIFLSSKFGKEKVFESLKDRSLSNQDSYSFFIESLICSVDYYEGLTLISFDEGKKENDMSSYKENLKVLPSYPNKAFEESFHSPFLFIDEFILSLIQEPVMNENDSKKRGFIRGVTYFSHSHQ